MWKSLRHLKPTNPTVLVGFTNQPIGASHMYMSSNNESKLFPATPRWCESWSATSWTTTWRQHPTRRQRPASPWTSPGTLAPSPVRTSSTCCRGSSTGWRSPALHCGTTTANSGRTLTSLNRSVKYVAVCVCLAKLNSSLQFGSKKRQKNLCCPQYYIKYKYY